MTRTRKTKTEARGDRKATRVQKAEQRIANVSGARGQAPGAGPKGVSIHTRAILVSLNISAWRAQRFDRKVTEEITDRKNASRRAGRFNKHLFGGEFVEYNELVAAMGRARNMFYEMTLPWDDAGRRILPTFESPTGSAWDKFMEAYRAAQNDVRERYEAFEDRFAGEVQKDRKRLNGMWNPDDYPDPRSLRDRFSMSLHREPIPLASDFRVSLPADEMEIIEQEMREHLEAKTAEAMKEAFARLGQFVERFIARMSDQNSRITSSLFEAASELPQTLRMLNVVGDPRLEALCSRVERELATYDPDTLRKDDDARAEAAARADDILASMSMFYTPSGDDEDE